MKRVSSGVSCLSSAVHSPRGAAELTLPPSPVQSHTITTSQHRLSVDRLGFTNKRDNGRRLSICLAFLFLHTSSLYCFITRHARALSWQTRSEIREVGVKLHDNYYTPSFDNNLYVLDESKYGEHGLLRQA